MFSPVYTKGEGENAVKKPLHQCNMEECLELKGTLFNKYQKLASIGKGSLAGQFLTMIKLVDERLAQLQIDMARAEAEKAALQKDGGNAQTSTTQRKASNLPDRWTRRSSTIT